MKYVRARRILSPYYRYNNEKRYLANYSYWTGDGFGIKRYAQPLEESKAVDLAIEIQRTNYSFVEVEVIDAEP